jgi:hypothetical protein
MNEDKAARMITNLIRRYVSNKSKTAMYGSLRKSAYLKKAFTVENMVDNYNIFFYYLKKYL